MQPKKHNRKTFCPWVTQKDPPGLGSDENFFNSNCGLYHSEDPKRTISGNGAQKTQALYQCNIPLRSTYQVNTNYVEVLNSQ